MPGQGTLTTDGVQVLGVYGAVNTALRKDARLGGGKTLRSVIKYISAVLDGDIMAIKSVISLCVTLIVADPLEEIVRVHGCVRVNLDIQEHTVPPWPLVPT